MQERLRPWFEVVRLHPDGGSGDVRAERAWKY